MGGNKSTQKAPLRDTVTHLRVNDRLVDKTQHSNLMVPRDSHGGDVLGCRESDEYFSLFSYAKNASRLSQQPNRNENATPSLNLVLLLWKPLSCLSSEGFIHGEFAGQGALDMLKYLPLGKKSGSC